MARFLYIYKRAEVIIRSHMVKSTVRRRGVKRLKNISIVLLTGLFLTPAILGAGLYRWVDDKGIVHFGDRIPVKYSKLKREVLSSQGVVLGTLAAQKTKEQLAADAIERKRLADLKLQAARKAERNRILLSSYSTTSDIDIARDQKVAQLVKQGDLLELNSSNLKQQQKAILTRIPLIRDSDDEDKEANLELIKTQLSDTNRNIRELKAKSKALDAEISDLHNYYEQEKKDFLHLIQARDKQRQAENHPLY